MLICLYRISVHPGGLISHAEKGLDEFKWLEVSFQPSACANWGGYTATHKELGHLLLSVPRNWYVMSLWRDFGSNAVAQAQHWLPGESQHLINPLHYLLQVLTDKLSLDTKWVWLCPTTYEGERVGRQLLMQGRFVWQVLCHSHNDLESCPCKILLPMIVISGLLCLHGVLTNPADCL